MNILYPHLWLAFWTRALTYKMTGKSEDWSTVTEHSLWVQKLVGLDVDMIDDMSNCCKDALTKKSYGLIRPLLHGCSMGLIVASLRAGREEDSSVTSIF